MTTTFEHGRKAVSTTKGIPGGVRCDCFFYIRKCTGRWTVFRHYLNVWMNCVNNIWPIFWVQIFTSGLPDEVHTTSNLLLVVCVHVVPGRPCSFKIRSWHEEEVAKTSLTHWRDGWVCSKPHTGPLCDHLWSEFHQLCRHVPDGDSSRVVIWKKSWYRRLVCMLIFFRYRLNISMIHFELFFQNMLNIYPKYVLNIC